MGVPMLAYPLFADQPMNSRYCVSVWQMALEIETATSRDDGRSYVQRHEVAAKVKALARQVGGVGGAAGAWGEAARQAVAAGGSSHLHMAAFVADMYTRARASISESNIIS